MKIRRKTQITVLTERFLIVRKSARFGCAACGAPLLAFDDAAIFLGKAAHELDGEIRNGSRHALETPGGRLVCCRAPQL